MRARIGAPISLALLVLLLASACTHSGGGSHQTTGMATLSVHMTDAPIDLANVQSVNVTLTGVTVFPEDSDTEMEVSEPAGEMEDAEEGKPIVLVNHPATFDLLTLTGGASVLLGSGEVPAGKYARIRLDISSAELVYKDGTTAPLKIDSNKVDVPIAFNLTVNQDKSITLDFNAASSVQVNDTGTGTLILRPVVTPVGS